MGYKWKTTPYLHQVKGVKRLLKQGYGGALLMEPRTGKTKTTIDWLSILNQQGKLKKVLIICPARVMDVWVAELLTHSPRRVNIVVWDRKARKDGPLPEHNPVFDMTVVIVNYNAFATPGKKLASGRRSKATGRFKFRSLIFKWIQGEDAACVLDESHKIKSPSGKTSNMVVSLGSKFTYRVILTGTPVTKAKRLHDLYMQWQFLNPSTLEQIGIYTVADMKDRMGRWTERNGFPQFLRANDQGVEEIRHAIHTDAYAVKREECFDLPPSENRIIHVPLTTSARVYDEMAERLVATLKDKLREEHTVEAGIPLTLALRLAQITGGCATTDEGKILRVGREKINVLTELVQDEAVEKEQKMVIAARFKPDLAAAARIGTQLGLPVYRLQGGISRQEATDSIRKFKELEGPALFVMQPSAGSLGIDLSAAHHLVWYSQTPNWTDYTQSNDRIALASGIKTYTYLIAPDTVDQILYDSLQLDGEVARHITTRPEGLLRSQASIKRMNSMLDINAS